MPLTIEGYTYITHKIVPRPWGPQVRFTMELPSGEHVNEEISISSLEAGDAELVQKIKAVCDRIKARKDYEAMRCHLFDDNGVEVREALNWLVRKIREYPNATYAQAETAWNAEWADSLFTFAKLTTFIQNKIQKDITWVNFKTYVINHHFEGVD